MKTKIQIKSIFGTVLFEYEKENNTIKDTLLEAIKQKTDLRGSNLSGSDLRWSNLSGSDLRWSNLSGSNLRGSDLSGSNLIGSDLSGSNLRWSNLRGSDLSGSNLRGSNLRGSNLRGSDLSGSNLSGSDLSGSDFYNIKIKKAAFFYGIYEYDCAAIISNKGGYYIKMGCYLRKLSEWEKDFWNNVEEFPNDPKNLDSNLRILAFETCKKWIELNK